jgi:hypothetical protein
MRYLVIIFLVTSFHSWAQDFDRYFSISWDVNKPLTNTRWIDETSAVGFKIGYHKLLNDRFSLGIDFSEAVYHHYEPTTTFITDDGALTTDYFNYLYSYGIVANGKYFLPTQSRRLMPYVGLGAGVALNRFVQYYNIYTDGEDSWGFLARPEAGVLVTFGGRVGIIASAHYDYSTAGSDYYDYSGFTNYGVNLGIVIMSY